MAEKFYDNFVAEDRWLFLLQGLGNTLLITVFAVMVGVVLGFLIAIIRATHDKNGNLKFLNLICKIYLTVIRGTPVLVQILIIYYVILRRWTSTRLLWA